MGIIGTTSFFPSKNLGCYGDGGALFTNDKTLAEKIRMISNHGQRVKYQHDIIGVNSRLDTLQAAILCVKLTHLSEYTRKRNAVADFYDHNLSNKCVATPVRFEKSTHVFHQYTVKIEPGNRDHFQKYLAAEGIPSMIYYPVPLHQQKAYQRFGFGLGSFPVAERLSNTVISIPIHTEMEYQELEYVCQIINAYRAII